MEETLEKINLNHLDKSTWESFRFEEIAQKISKTVDPNSTTLETYVGLEHIDPDDIHIRRFGSPDDVSGGKLKCYPGDVIFGKRRAYQRKAAIADFEGICSAHAFVFRANPEVIDPKLFPFFLHSDQFMHRMVDISVGGLSPTINWGDLKHQEFLLPPKSEQARLAELLWAMDEVIEREREVLNSFSLLKQSKIRELYFGDNAEKIYIELKDIAELITKGTTPSSIGESFTSEGINFIKIESLTPEGYFIDEKFEHIDEGTHKKLKRSQLKPNDILFSIAGALGRSAIVHEELCPANINQALALIRLKEGAIAEYVLEYLKSDLIKDYIDKVHVKGAQPNLSLKNVNEIKVPFPLHNIQKEVANKVAGLNSRHFEIKNKISSSQALLKSLINQIF
ncbi:restriction endonuclease subunit S [Algoriphagus halophilus]|uniref:Type I restriction enzyme, S subunit n=1 Tax=Algoriphagus halophilus TaxID=226505 RepID=A0A1N6D5V9_9BACT|nr:restriction endonuclease subunit S [Algoriphagus halophilus]SIN66220.1 type I restriction enzyme, S subunit [Algoriphagus halophilus]